MNISIGRYTFDGPYTNTGSLQNRSGIYAILCESGGDYFVIDIGESAIVKTRIETHDRIDCWNRHCKGILHVAVLYTPNLQSAGRTRIEQELRNGYNPVCGKR